MDSVQKTASVVIMTLPDVCVIESGRTRPLGMHRQITVSNMRTERTHVEPTTILTSVRTQCTEYVYKLRIRTRISVCMQVYADLHPYIPTYTQTFACMILYVCMHACMQL